MALFASNHKGFVQVVRHRTPKSYNHVTGEPNEYHRRLAAEFGVFGPERQVYNPETGNMTTTADITGGFFDSVAIAEQEGWTDEEREAVEAKLRQVARERPDFVREIIAVAVAAPSPWQTFDATDAGEIVKIAETLGLVPEALRYEREHLNRPILTEPLAALVAEMDEDDQRRADPIMEIPPGALDAGIAHGVRIGKAPEMTDSGIVKSTPGFVEKPHQITV